MSEYPEMTQAIKNSILLAIERYQKAKDFTKPIEFSISTEQYFRYLLQIKSQKKQELFNRFLYGYLLLMKDFIQKLIEQNENQVDQILLYIVSVLQYEKWAMNRLLMKIGDIGSKFYIILSGSVDLLVQTETLEVIREKEYLRYLALLYCFEEYGLLEKVLNENYERYPIEITKSAKSNADDPKKDTSPDDKKPIKQIFTKDLLSYLTPEEINDYHTRQDSKYTSQEEYNYNTPITINEYISRIKNYHLPEPINTDIDNELRKFVIIGYKYLLTLKTGNKFGDVALSELDARRRASIIISSECHFGILNKRTYVASIKTVLDKSNHLFIIFILSTPLFKGFPSALLKRKYINNFVTEKILKGDIVLIENMKSNMIIILKEGYYEMTMRRSLNELGNILDYYINKIINSSLLSKNEKKKLSQLQAKMIKEKEELVQGTKSLQSLYKFYNMKFEIKVKCLLGPDVVGLDQLNYIDDNNLYELKCLKVGEIIKLPKDTFHRMCFNDNSIRVQQEAICDEKNLHLVTRLIDIRKTKLKEYFSHHYINKFLYLDEYNLKSQDILIQNKQLVDTDKRQVMTRIIDNRIQLADPKKLRPSSKDMELFRRIKKSQKQSKYINLIIGTLAKGKSFNWTLKQNSSELFRNTLLKQKISRNNHKSLNCSLNPNNSLNSNKEETKLRLIKTHTVLKKSINDDNDVSLNNELEKKSSCCLNKKQLQRCRSSISRCYSKFDYESSLKEQYLNYRNEKVVYGMRSFFLRNKSQLIFKLK